MSGTDAEDCCGCAPACVNPTVHAMSATSQCLIKRLLLYFSASGVRLNVFAAGVGSSFFSPLARAISSTKPPGSPFRKGADTGAISSPALIIFAHQPERHTH